MWDFIGKRNIFFVLSGLLIIGTFAYSMQFWPRPLNLGIDFTGGTDVLLNVPALAQQSDSEVGRGKFLEGFRSVITPLGLERSVLQVVEKTQVSMRTRSLNNEQRDALVAALTQAYPGSEVMEVDTIGPTVGAQLRTASIWIVALSSLGILIYLTFRFEFIFGLAAIVATLHDALITLGISAVFRVEVDTAFVAAILTIIGYSVNDTIVLFDRVRERLADNYQGSLKDLLNLSIRQTLGRTINTVLTVLFMVLALYLFGGSTIHDFSFVMLVGVSIGTYSSIFIAVPIVYAFRSRIMASEKA